MTPADDERDFDVSTLPSDPLERLPVVVKPWADGLLVSEEACRLLTEVFA